MKNVTSHPSGTDIKLPEGWNDITLQDFAECDFILSKMREDDNEQKQVKAMSQILLQLSDLTMDKLKKMDMVEVGKLFDYMRVVLIPPDDEQITEFYFNDQEWHLPTKGMESATYEQWMDCMTVEQLVDESESDFSVMAGIIAILCKREGESMYESGEFYEQRKALFIDLTMDIVWQVFFFTKTLRKRLEKDLPTFSEAERAVLEELLSMDGIRGALN